VRSWTTRLFPTGLLMNEKPVSVAKDVLLGLSALFNDSEFERLFEKIDQLLHQSPDAHQLYLIRAVASMELKNFEEAHDDLRQALTLAPADANVTDQLGICCRHLGDNKRAAEYLLRSFTLGPNKKRAQMYLLVAIENAKTDDAIEIIFKKLYPHFFSEREMCGVSVSNCVFADDWYRANGARIVEVAPASEVSMETGNGSICYESEALEFAVLPGAQAISGWDFAIAPTGEVLNGSGYTDISTAYNFMPHLANESKTRVIHVDSKDTIDVDEDALFLSAPERYHFGHWFFDCLPRLMGRNCTGGNPAKVFVPEGLPSHHRDILLHFVKPDQIIEAKLGQRYRFRSLTVNLAKKVDRINPELVKFIRRAIGSSQSVQFRHGTGKRIFLERSRTRRGRNIHNMSELNEVLSRFNFERVRRPELTTAQQNALFADAEIVLGAMGSDMVSAYQMRAGSNLIFLGLNDAKFHDVIEESHNYVQRMCALSGISFSILRCKATNENDRYNYAEDIVVDCDELRQLLSGILKDA